MQDIAGFSLRELVWRADALQMEEWDRAAWICLHQPRLKAAKFADFHPLRCEESVSPEELLERKEKLKQSMTKGLSDSERQARFKEFWRRRENDGRK